MLASDFTNPLLPLDVSDDGFVAPIDALLVINDVNQNGSRQLDPPQNPVTEFIDTSGDGFVSPIDALLVINVLNTDTAPPELSAQLNNDTGVAGDLVTSDASITGNVSDRSGINRLEAIIDGGLPISVDFDAATGDFLFVPPLASGGADDGAHTLQFVATSALNQTSGLETLSIQFDTVAPQLNLDLDAGFDTGTQGDKLTSLATVNLAGQTEPAAELNVPALAITIEADPNGNFTVADVPLAQGINTFDFTANDLAGNQVSGTQRILRSDAPDAFSVVEVNRLAQEALRDIDVGSTNDPRQIRVEFDTELDKALVGPDDSFSIFIVDANDSSNILLAGTAPESAVFTQRANESRHTPGVTKSEGQSLVIDVSSIAGQDAQLMFQLLSVDQTIGSIALVENIQSEPIAQAPFDLNLLPINPIAPGESIDIANFDPTSDIDLLLEDARYSADSGKFTGTVRVINQGPPVGRNLVVALKGLPAGVGLDNSAGTIDGSPYLNLSPAVPRGGLETGATSLPMAFSIDNPQNIRLDVIPEIFSGGPNQEPALEPIDPVDLFPGDVFTVPLVASDADGDTLIFDISPLAVQPNLPSMELSADGQLTFRPEPDQLGDFQFLVEVSDGAASATQTVSLSVVADPNSSTRISGKVLDTNRQPIVDITVNLGSQSVKTDASGSFLLEAPPGGFDSDALEVHGEEFAGPEVFPFIAEKLPLLFPGGRDLFPGVNNTVERAIYLPALDVAGGTIVDPGNDVSVEQEIAPGENASVFVAAGSLKDQQGADFTGTLSITEVPRDLTPAALPPGVFPGTVVTIQPGEMVFQQPAPLTLPNRAELPRGTQLDLFSINPVTGEFDLVGVGEVSSNGASIDTISGGVRNSSWHFFAVQLQRNRNRVPDANSNRKNQDELCNDCETLANQTVNQGKTGANGPSDNTEKTVATSDVELHSGTLRESHALPTYQSLGQQRGVSLAYNSGRADLRPIVHFDVGDANGDFVVASAKVRQGGVVTQVPGATPGHFGLLGGEHFWRIPNGDPDISLGLQIEMPEQPTGVYQVELEHGVRQFNGEAFVGTSVLSVVPVNVVNSVASVFGAGWELVDWQQIFEQPDGSALLVDGDGTQLLFSPPENEFGPFESPAGDFSQLRKLPDGRFERTSKDRTTYLFNDHNQLASVTDRNGNQTTYTFDAQQRLSGYVDPVGLETVFGYTGDHVTEILDPADRTTRLEYDAAGNLIRIVDADGSFRQFEYDARHNMTAEITKRGFREEITYGFHGRVERTLRRDGTTSVFAPAQVEGLFPASMTVDHSTAPRAIEANDAAIAGFADPAGRVTQLILDAAGQSRAHVDELGSQAQEIRDADNLVTTQIDGRGNGTYYKYDDRGNVIEIRESIFEKGSNLFTGERISTIGSISNVALADLDQDGDLDAVGTISTEFFNFPPFVSVSKFHVFENVGNGQLEFFQSFSTGGTFPRDLTLQDINGDSIPDITVVNEQGESLTQRLGNGDLTFAPRMTFDLDDSPRGFDLGDLNGDGHLDALVARQNNAQAAVLLSDGLGSFELNETPAGFGTLDMVLQDFDDDGLLDYAAATTNSIRVAFGDGVGGFINRQTITSNSTTYNAVQSADVNGDGLADIVGTTPGFVHVFLNLGSGQFAEEFFATGAGTGNAHRSITVEDLNHDGQLDIGVPSDSLGTIIVFYNQGLGRFSLDARQSFIAGADANSLTLGDLDGDGDFEAVIGNEISSGFNGGITVLEGKPDGTFLQQRARGPAGSIPNVVKSADVNNDGIPDLVTLASFEPLTNSLAVKLGDGTGNFGTPIEVPLNLNRSNDFTIADFNNDRLADFAAIARFDDDIVVVLQNTDGTFQDPVGIDFVGNGLVIDAADINRDGNQDIVSRFSGDTVRVLLGDGTGAFPDISEFEMDLNGAGGPDQMQLVDLNDDGMLDVLGISPPRFFAATNFITSLGDGDGGFAAPREFGMGIGSTQSVDADDFNGDGFTDLIAIGKGISVRLGNGDGTFAAQVVTEFDGERDGIASQIEIRDYDSDGDLDFLTLLPQASVMALFLNDGNGAFSESARFVVGDGPRSVVTTDFDFDGDIDVAVASANRTAVSVHLNQTEHACESGACRQTLTYDSQFNQLTEIVDALGRTTQIEIDPANGNALSTRQVLGAVDGQGGESDDLVTQTTYNSFGLMETQTDSLGRVKEFEYDAFGRLIQVTHAKGSTVEAQDRYEYDAAGNLSASIDPKGNRTEFTYDALNRLIRIRDAQEGVTSLQFDSAGNRTQITDSLGNATTFEFDALDRQTADIDALDGRNSFEYDGAGNLIRRTDRLSRVTEFRYDARNRLIETIDPLGGSQFNTYDLDDNLIRVVDENGHGTQFVMDARNRPIAMIDALQGISTSEFDAADQKVSTIDEIGRVTRFSYDDAGRPIAMQLPDPDADGPETGSILQTVFDKAHNVTLKVDELDRETAFEYDDRNRLVRTVDPDPDGPGPLLSPETEQHYDANSMVVQVIDPLGRVTEFAYDALDRLILQTLPDPDGPGPATTPQTQFTYDAYSNPLSTTDALGNTTTYEYDPLHRLVRMTTPDPDGVGPLASPVTSYIYDAADQRITVTDPLDRITRHAYDALGRVIQTTAPDPDGLGPDPSPILRFEYDAVGNQTSFTDSLGNKIESEYDALDRLTRETKPDPDGAGPAERPVRSFSYDAAGQLLLVIDPLGRDTQYFYDGQGRNIAIHQPDPDGAGPSPRPVLSFEFDAVGNTLAYLDPLGNRTDHQYDSLNRMISSRHPDPDGAGPESRPEFLVTYDAAGQLVKTTDPLGRELHFVYDALGRIVQTTEPDPDGPGPLESPVLNVQYDLIGNELSRTDPLGNTTRMEHDNLYRLVTVIEPDPDGAGPETSPTTRNEYDAAGQLLSTTDPLQRTTSYVYDDLGRLIQQTDPDPDGAGPLQAPVNELRYDLHGNRIAMVDPLGNETNYVYDGLHRQIRVIDADPDGAGPQVSPIMEVFYDVADQMIEQVDPLGRVTSYEYDGLGRLIRRVDPDPDGAGPQLSPSVETTYDLAGNPLSTSNALGETNTYTYDALYRVIASTDPVGGVSQREYDLANNQTAFVDPVGNRTTWQFDDLNRPVLATDPLGNNTTFEYDVAGNLIRSTDRLDRVITYEYDDLQRRIQENWLEANVPVHQITYTFDNADQVLGLDDAFASYEYSYDELGRQTASAADYTGFTDTVSINSQYDVADNLTGVSVLIGNTSDLSNERRYDGLNRVTQVMQSGAGGNSVAEKRIDFTYDVASQPFSQTRFADLLGTQEVVVSTYTFDGASRLTGLSHRAQGSELADYDFSFDQANRIVEVGASQDGDASYSYDARGQLTNSVYDFQADSQFTYDANGNRTGSGNVVGDNNRTLSDGVFNYEYDDEGNRVVQVEIATGEVTGYEWDHRNRLTRVTERASNAGVATQIVTHSYDAANRWIGTSVDSDGDGPGAPQSEFYFYDGDQIILDFDGAGPQDLAHRYLWGERVDELLADEALSVPGEAGDILWALGDHQSTIRDLVEYEPTTDTSSVINHIVYDAFGNVTAETDSGVDTRFGFTGRPVDAATGLQNNLNRWYDPQLGKWLSDDPIGFEAGDPNLTRYVANTPTSRIDPSGLTDMPGSFMLNPGAVSDMPGSFVMDVQPAPPPKKTDPKIAKEVSEKMRELGKKQAAKMKLVEQMKRVAVDNASDSLFQNWFARVTGDIDEATKIARDNKAIASELAKLKGITEEIPEKALLHLVDRPDLPAEAIRRAAAQEKEEIAFQAAKAAKQNSLLRKGLGHLGNAFEFLGKHANALTVGEIFVAWGVSVFYVGNELSAAQYRFKLAAQHEAFLARRAERIRNEVNAAVRAKNDEVREKNKAIREAGHRAHEIKQEQDDKIREHAAKERAFLEKQRRNRRLKSAAPNAMQLLNQLLPAKREPVTTKDPGNLSPLELFFGMAGEHDPDFTPKPKAQSVAETKAANVCPPENR